MLKFPTVSHSKNSWKQLSSSFFSLNLVKAVRMPLNMRRGTNTRFRGHKSLSSKNWAPEISAKSGRVRGKAAWKWPSRRWSPTPCRRRPSCRRRKSWKSSPIPIWWLCTQFVPIKNLFILLPNLCAMAHFWTFYGKKMAKENWPLTISYRSQHR